MVFFFQLFWVLFAIVCLLFLLFLTYRQNEMKKEQEYLIKLNHEILGKLKSRGERV